MVLLDKISFGVWRYFFEKRMCFFLHILVLWLILLGCVQKEKGISKSDIKVKVGSYNVFCGNWGIPQRFAEAIEPYDFDIIGFSEVPGGSWTSEVGQILGMEYSYVGTISSANHENKYKAILSRTPLENVREFKIGVNAPYIWSPSSMVGAETVVRGVRLTVYCLHVPGVEQSLGSACDFIVSNILPEENNSNLIIMGDYNNLLGDVAFAPFESGGMRPAWQEMDIDVSNESTHKHIETGVESGVIDHIFYNSDSSAKVVNGGILGLFNPPDEDKEMAIYKEEWLGYGKPLSDHHLVWATFEISFE